MQQILHFRRLSSLNRSLTPCIQRNPLRKGDTIDRHSSKQFGRLLFAKYLSRPLSNCAYVKRCYSKKLYWWWAVRLKPLQSDNPAPPLGNISTSNSDLLSLPPNPSFPLSLSYEFFTICSFFSPIAEFILSSAWTDALSFVYFCICELWPCHVHSFESICFGNIKTTLILPDSPSTDLFRCVEDKSQTITRFQVHPVHKYIQRPQNAYLSPHFSPPRRWRPSFPSAQACTSPREEKRRLLHQMARWSSHYHRRVHQRQHREWRRTTSFFNRYR